MTPSEFLPKDPAKALDKVKEHLYEIRKTLEERSIFSEASYAYDDAVDLISDLIDMIERS